MAKKTRRYNREISEQLILKAAEEIFAKEGFKGATTRAIAKKAGMNVANIAHYFGDKEGLLMRILQVEVAATRSRELSYPPQSNLLDELLQYSSTSFDYFLTKISMIKIICGHFMTDARFHKKFHETITLIYRNQEFESRLQNLLKNKKLSDRCSIETIIDDIDDQVIMLIMSGIILRLDPEKKIREALDRYVRIYSDYLR